MEYGLLGLIVLITSNASGAAKIAWVLGIIILPVLGFIVWLIAGPRGNKAHV